MLWMSQYIPLYNSEMVSICNPGLDNLVSRSPTAKRKGDLENNCTCLLWLRKCNGCWFFKLFVCHKKNARYGTLRLVINALLIATFRFLLFSLTLHSSLWNNADGLDRAFIGFYFRKTYINTNTMVISGLTNYKSEQKSVIFFYWLDNNILIIPSFSK